MDIKRAKEEIKDTIEAYLLKDENGDYEIPVIRQRPVLLIGPPGVGKTQIMEQIARECQVALVSYTITHHTRQSAIGLPFIEKKSYGGREFSVTEYTLSEIVASVYEKMESTGLKEGILFIDEINCVSETLAPAMLQFLQCKSFGSHVIPRGWIIAAAGNPPEYNKSVREFDVVTLDRIKKINVEPDFQVWKEYAYKENIHSAVISYLNIRRQFFCHVETTADGKMFATPRGWEDLSRLIQVYEKLGKKADRDVIFQYIQHPKIAKDFANYLELYYKYQKDYQVEAILSGDFSESLCDRIARAGFDEKISVTGLILSALSGGFRSLFTEEAVMEMVMNGLKKFQKAGEGSLQPVAVLEEAGAELDREYQDKLQAELLNRQMERIYKTAVKRLEDIARKVKLERENQDFQSVWQTAREEFMEFSDAYEEESRLWEEKLEHGFDFMEAAFGNGQEMVLFLTELNSNDYCIHFLKEHPCERYYQYNKNLMFDRQEELLLERL